MTAAGLALIAGGLATLISFRAVLFGAAGRGARRRQARALEAPSRRSALTAGRAGPEEPAAVVPDPEPLDVSGDEAARVEAGRSRRGRRGRRRALVAAAEERPEPEVSGWSDEDERGGLASIGLADDEEDSGPGGEGRLAVVAEDDDLTPETDACSEVEDGIEPDPVRGRPSDHHGDRVEGWVRPEYHDLPDEPRPGEYWTPIPVDLAGDAEPSAKGYGWPRPVERLPAVPDYEPATGFDLIPVVSEPTEAMPAWPLNDERPGRIRLPRSWSTRNEKPMRREEAPPVERRRPRPRPRPEPPVDRSTVYVSRHAADPPPRQPDPPVG
jgi:hypothetical protein